MANHNPPTNGLDKRKEHINRKGRPKSFDKLRELAQQIANEIARTTGKLGADGQIIPGNPIVIDGHIATVAEMMLRQWANSKDPRFAIAFMEYAYGRVPAKQENMNIDLTTLTDEQLQMLKDGKDLMDVLKHPGA